MGTTVTKAVDSNTSELKEIFGSIAQKLDDVVLSVKSVQSDNASPFNSLPVENTNQLEQPKLVTSDPTHDEPLLDGQLDLKLTIIACAVLEITNGKKKMIDSLYGLGLLNRDQMGMIDRIRELLSKIGTPLKPKELALLACNMAGNQRLDEGGRKILSVLSTWEKGS